MRHSLRCASLVLAATACSTSALATEPAYSWRYYRPSNTGIGGDYNESIWIGPDGDPWIGSYHPVWEEGGLAKFIQAENRWVNISNDDYPIIGHPNDVGTSRVIDMVADNQGKLWLGTGRGVLRFDPAVGPSSLVRYGPGNSTLNGDWTTDLTVAPDGSVWVNENGLSQFNPTTNTWTHRGGGAVRIAAQPKSSGGYFIWTSVEGSAGVDRWDSTTQIWTHVPFAIGNPALFFSKDSVDDAGNMWILRLADNQNNLTLDCLRPDGSWVTPPLPPLYTGSAAPYACIKPFGDMQAYVIVIDPTPEYRLYRVNGTSWTDLGAVPHSGFIDDMDFAPDGTIWVCGTGQGGAMRRDATTGQWQRYRITNTSQFDNFNNDLTIDPTTGDMYACANAGTGIGGMVKFDGTRWTGWSEYGYGLGHEWPFPTDNSEAIYVRPSTGRVAVNPMNNFTHEWDPETGLWSSIPGGPDQIKQYREDSLGRLWAIGHYGGLGYFQNGNFTTVPGGGWGGSLHADPDRPGTVWANQDWQITRTDGTYTLTRLVEDFGVAGSFTGLAVDQGGVAWVGVWGQFGSNPGVLIRFDADTGDYQTWQHNLGWPFPGEYVRPITVTPDGRLWMSYDSEYPSTDMGLLWWDGTNVGTFPAPPGGAWQWGGLPHAGILDLEVKVIPDGYELWMSCISRGFAVLSVTDPNIPGDVDGDGHVTLTDLAMLLASFGACTGDPAFIDAADFNASGCVDLSDLAVLLANFGV